MTQIRSHTARPRSQPQASRSIRVRTTTHAFTKALDHFVEEEKALAEIDWDRG